jgi:hypothetical protein
MQFSVQFHDVSQNLKNGVQPVFRIRRPVPDDEAAPKPFSIAQPGRIGIFWVPTKPILSPDQGWTKTSQGEFVLVPMFSYKTASPSKSRLIASGIELGWRALQGGLPLFENEPKSVLLLIGHECNHTPQGYDYYVGLSVRTT